MKTIGQSSVSVMLAMSLSFSFLCCTVRDDRDVCPSGIELDFSGYPGRDFVLAADCGGGRFFCDTVRVPDALSGDPVYRKVIEGKILKITVFAPFESVGYVGGAYRPGGRCAALEAWSARILPASVPSVLKVRMHKEYCRLNVTFRGGEGCFLLLRSRIDGILPGGALSEGEYTEILRRDRDALYTVNVLRQKDASLMLDIIDGREGEYGRVLKSIALGNLMARAGYSWSAEDLDDMDLTIDLDAYELTLSAGKWSGTVKFEFVF